MAGINIQFQVINKSKVHWMYIGELVSYDMDIITLKFADGNVCQYLHSEVIPYGLEEVTIC